MTPASTRWWRTSISTSIQRQLPAFAALVGGIDLRLTIETLETRLFRDYPVVIHDPR
jgi:hypothetical protein